MGPTENLHEMLRSMVEVYVFGARGYHYWCSIRTVLSLPPVCCLRFSGDLEGDDRATI